MTKPKPVREKEIDEFIRTEPVMIIADTLVFAREEYLDPKKFGRDASQFTKRIRNLLSTSTLEAEARMKANILGEIIGLLRVSRTDWPAMEELIEELKKL